MLLQAFDGAWAPSEALAAALSCALPKLAPPEGVAGADAWATALVLAFLVLRLPGQEEEWVLVAAKAKEWLRAAGCDADALVERARSSLVC